MAAKVPTEMMKAAASAAVKRVLGAIISRPGHFDDVDVPDADPNRFVVAFCGSGTGHMTQAATVAKLLMEQGFELCGVVTDRDADERLLAEVVRPLGAEVLVLPSITLVNPDRGVASPPRVAASARQAQIAMGAHDGQIRGFFRESRCGLVLNFFHIMLAWYLQSRRLPESVDVLSIAAQFAIAQLPLSKLPSIEAVIAKSTVDVMSQIFAGSGPCIPLTALDDGGGGVAPVIELPAPLGGGAGPGSPRLVLCYFLVRRDAVRLERLLHRHPVEGVAFHCFTATALAPPRGRQLSLHSHVKERGLFRELFAQCTGAIVSSGNETIWEAVCRGVPVLTLPTAGHGEQVINSVLHARNHPNLVRARRKLDVEDVRWVASFEGDSASRAESERLRAWSTKGGVSRLVSTIKGRARSPCKQPEAVVSI